MTRSVSRSLLATAGLAAALGLSSAAHAAGDPVRGAYLAAISDCGGCHNQGAMTPEPNLEQPLSGSEIGFEVPGLGTFYPPNLTNDEATGLGSWTDEQIANAIRTGERPDGRILAPIMPWISYAAYTDADIMDLVAYLRSLPVVEHQVPGPFGPGETPTSPYQALIMPAAQ